MTNEELLNILELGEDTRHEFKQEFDSEVSIAQELIALANTKGGYLIFGVDDYGKKGYLSSEDVKNINDRIANVSEHQIKPALNTETQNFNLNGDKVVVVSIEGGLSKPYMDKNGVIFVRSGTSKKKATSREQIQRLFQSSQLVHADEVPANGITVGDLDREFFEKWLKKEFNGSLSIDERPLVQLLQNMNLAKDGFLNIAGALLFGKGIEFKLPMFMVKAVAFPGNEATSNSYLDSRDLTGNISDVFRKALSFVVYNLKQVQGDKNFNTTGELEIPLVVFEELIANALIHRDYFLSAPIKLFVFQNRIEIISPGHLPNNLTVENIKLGQSNVRNPILNSFATKGIIPYRGVGTGINRSLGAYSEIEFLDERELNQFRVIVKRKTDDF